MHCDVDGQSMCTGNPAFGLNIRTFGRAGLEVSGATHVLSSSSSLLLSSLEFSDTKVYRPSLRAHFGTAAHFCKVVVLKLSSVPIGPSSIDLYSRARMTCFRGVV